MHRRRPIFATSAWILAALAVGLLAGCGRPAAERGDKGGKDPMLRPEFAKLRPELVKAARRTFEMLRERHPDDQFYAYALYTDDDAGGVTAAAASAQSLQR